METFHGTTIVCARRATPQGWQVAIGGDGQVTLGHIVVKASARKVRLIHQGRILAGFAGGTADAFTLFERFEAKLDKHQGNLLRSAVELANDWNYDNRFAMSYRGKDGSISLVLDVNLDKGGVSAANFEDTLNWWDDALVRFKQHIDY